MMQRPIYYRGPDVVIEISPTRKAVQEAKEILDLIEKKFDRDENRRALAAPWDDLITEACGLQVFKGAQQSRR